MMNKRKEIQNKKGYKIFKEVVLQINIYAPEKKEISYVINKN